MIIRCKRLHPDAVIPAYQTDGAAGMDLVACEQAVIHRHSIRVVNTGIGFEIPIGFEGAIRPRSSMDKRMLFVPANVIDSDYRGPVGVIIHNASDDYLVIKRGERIGQIVFAPVVRARLDDVGDGELVATVRGERGWGSTGS